MIRLSVYYPAGDDVHFDSAYYEGPHRDLVHRVCEPYGLARSELFRGAVGFAGRPVTYIGGGHLYFSSIDKLEAAFTAHGAEIVADLENFTNSQPTLQVDYVADVPADAQ